MVVGLPAENSYHDPPKHISKGGDPTLLFPFLEHLAQVPGLFRAELHVLLLFSLGLVLFGAATAGLVGLGVVEVLGAAPLRFRLVAGLDGGDHLAHIHLL